jgi:hypothetical protein
MTEETKRTLIITLGTALTILLGIYIYTQNTGFNACYKEAIESGAFTEGQAVYRCSSSN